MNGRNTLTHHVREQDQWTALVDQPNSPCARIRQFSFFFLLHSQFLCSIFCGMGVRRVARGKQYMQLSDSFLCQSSFTIVYNCSKSTMAQFCAEWVEMMEIAQCTPFLLCIALHCFVGLCYA